ncbi:MAG TPA: type VI secretion system baseplate subunit TssG [Gemmataceae bacterium]|nr:type VI secretion system baseplate subunit TssG [Gemmataceae bacterium]
MAATSRRRADTVAGPLEERLFTEGFAFDFFQAVRLLEKLAPHRRPVGREGPPRAEVVRFRALPSLSFPASAIYELARTDNEQPPTMTVAFLGLTGPSGALPHHYTELVMRLLRDGKGAERYALRDWLDLFNHRLISLFYRAWEKYRFYVPYERGEPSRPEPDTFTRSLFSLVGLGMPPLRNRLLVRAWDEKKQSERVLARIEDLAVIYYGGLFARRQRTAVGLQAVVEDYFDLPAQVWQFQGQWLRLDVANQSRLGTQEHNNQLGVNTVAGERVWDVQSKLRVRLGPLRYARFLELLPDRTPIAARKTFFLLCHLVRLYAEVELDFDVQLVLAGDEVPACRLIEEGIGPRLGWNTWLLSQPRGAAAEDAVFEGEAKF